MYNSHYFPPFYVALEKKKKRKQAPLFFLHVEKCLLFEK